MQSKAIVLLTALFIAGCAGTSKTGDGRSGSEREAFNRVRIAAEKLRTGAVLRGNGGATLKLGVASAVGREGRLTFQFYPYRLHRVMRVSAPGEKAVLKDDDEYGVFLATSADQGKTWQVNDLLTPDNAAVREFVPGYKGTPSIPKFVCCEDTR